VEVGPRELERDEVVLVRRDAGTKVAVPVAGIDRAVPDALDAVQAALADEAENRRRSATAETASVAEAEEAARTGFAVVPWRALGTEGEARLNRAGVSVRLLTRADGSLPARGPGSADDADDLVAVVARAY